MPQETIKQLNKLKQIVPDKEWKANNKEILMNQIANSSSERTSASDFVIFVKEIFSNNLLAIKQSAYGLAVILLLMVGGGFFSISAASEVTPGSFLYAVKLVGEKTQVFFTSNQEDKVKLAVKFASRRAQEIESLAAINEHSEISDVADDLSAEIIDVKERLMSIENDYPDLALKLAKEIDSKTNELRNSVKRAQGYINKSSYNLSNKLSKTIDNIDATNLQALNTIIKNSDSKANDSINERVANSLQATKDKINEVKNNTSEFFIANLGRSEQGIQVYSQQEKQDTEQKTKVAEQKIAEAESLLDKNNFEEALIKINESYELINEVTEVIEEKQFDEEIGTSTPQVKGVIEGVASSTE